MQLVEGNSARLRKEAEHEAVDTAAKAAALEPGYARGRTMVANCLH